MAVHSLHVFDRKGKTLFTKRYIQDGASSKDDETERAEQRKLVFGMLFSLREVVNSLSPSSDVNPIINDGGLHAVRTGASTLFNFETTSGLRFALYCTNQNAGAIDYYSDAHSANQQQQQQVIIRNALKFIYNDLWIPFVTRSPLYSPTEPDVYSTNFEQKLDAYFAEQPWFR